MKKLVPTTLLGLALATGAFATSQEFSGTGIDGQPCQVKVDRDGTTIKSIELTGATKTFEILSENGSEYGPSTEIDANGAVKMLDLLHDNPHMFSYMKVTKMFLQKGEVVNFNTNDVPRLNEDDNSGWFNMTFSMNLYYDKEGRIKEVKANSKMKTAAIFTLASQRFTCK